jgi:hypothetical protein
MAIREVCQILILLKSKFPFNHVSFFTSSQLNIVNNQQASSPQAKSKPRTLVNKIINFAGA